MKVIATLKNGWSIIEGKDSFQLRSKTKVLFESTNGFEIGMHDADTEKARKAFNTDPQQHIRNLERDNICILEKTFDNKDVLLEKSGLVFSYDGNLLFHEKAFCDCFDLKTVCLVDTIDDGQYDKACCHNNAKSDIAIKACEEFLLTKSLLPIARGFWNISYNTDTSKTGYPASLSFDKFNNDRSDVITHTINKNNISKTFGPEHKKLSEQLLRHMRDINVLKYMHPLNNKLIASL